MVKHRKTNEVVRAFQAAISVENKEVKQTKILFQGYTKASHM